MDYPLHVETKLRGDDPEWAEEILALLYDSVFDRTQEHVADLNTRAPTPPQMDLFDAQVGRPETAITTIRRIAKRLHGFVPESLRREGGLMTRLIESTPAVVNIAQEEAKMEFQRPGGTPQVHIRVTRRSIEIECLTPHRIKMNR